MKAIKVSFIIEEGVDAEHFITNILPKLKKDNNLKQVCYHKCTYEEV